MSRLASLPSPLGQSIYVIGTYEAGQMYAPDRGTVTRQDVFFGLAAETPLGAVTLGPAIRDHHHDHDHRKFVFTLGRFSRGNPLLRALHRAEIMPSSAFESPIRMLVREP